MAAEDIKLLKEAVSEGPIFFRSFKGWQNFGRKGKTIMVAQFTDAVGSRITRGISALQRMAAKPPKNFSPSDRTLLAAVIKDGPAFVRR